MSVEAVEGTEVVRTPASRALTAPIADDAFYRGDPFPHYARMRAEAPVVWSPDGGYWVVSTNEELMIARHTLHALRDAQALPFKERCA